MKQILYSPVYGSIGSLILLALLQPFGIDQMGSRRIPFILGECACVFLCLFLSECFFLWVCPRLSSTGNAKRKESSSIWRLAVVLAPSFIINTCLVSASLLCFCGWFYFDDIFNGWIGPEGFTLRPYLNMTAQVMFVAFFIYIWAIYSASNVKLKDELSELRALNKLLEERQEAVATQNEEQPAESLPAAICCIKGNYHNDILEIDPQNIVYVESMSNYADICYMQEGSMEHKTMRITLKQLRESLSEVECLMSCHRAFIVNLNFVVSISPRVSGGYQLDVFGCDKQIPVSRTYIDEIKQRMKKEVKNNK